MERSPYPNYYLYLYPIITFKREPTRNDAVFNEVLAARGLAEITTHKQFTAFLPTDIKFDLLHMMLRAISEKWTDIQAEIALMRKSSPGSNDGRAVTRLIFSDVQILDQKTLEDGYYFTFSSPNSPTASYTAE